MHTAKRFNKSLAAIEIMLEGIFTCYNIPLYDHLICISVIVYSARQPFDFSSNNKKQERHLGQRKPVRP